MKTLKRLIIFILVIIAVFFYFDKCSSDDSNRGSGWKRDRSSLLDKRSTYDDDLIEIDTSDNSLEFDEYPRNNNDLADFLFVVLGIILFWYAIIAIPRFIWVVIGRSFGFYNPKDFNRFTRFGLPWRVVYRPLHNIRLWFQKTFLSGKKGTAKFSSLLETMSLVYKPNDIFLGRLSAFGVGLFQPVGINGDRGRHITIVAGTGSGKTTYLMTMLGLHEGNMFVIDCDAQMYNSLHRRQGNGGKGIIGKGKEIFVLDPYNQSVRGISSNWNPIEEIDAAVEQHGEEMAVDAAVTLAQGLIKISDTHNEWVYTAARSFMTGLILYVWRYSPPEQRNLLRVRELLTQGLQDDDFAEYDSFDVLIEAMKLKDDFNGIIAEAAASMSGKSGDKNYPREAAIDQTFWISIPQIAKTLRHSDFRCKDLKINDASIFVVAPVTDIQGKLSGWVRALTMMTMEAFQKTPGKPKNPCLFAIDEMPSLGRIPVLVDASAVFRKYKVRLITITQDIKKLKKAYPDEWSSFLGGSECVIWMANEESETLNHLSQVLGKATIKEHTERKGMLLRKSTVLREDREIMSPDQLSLYLDDTLIVTRAGNRALRLKPAPYFTELPVYYYEPDKSFGDKSLRAFTRELLIKNKIFKSQNSLDDLK